MSTDAPGRSTEVGEILDTPGGLYVPVRQEFVGEGTIRWAVGSPEGPRSQTWVLVGRPDGSFYLAPREQMGDIKLSLHPEKWRMAFTEQAAEHRLGLGPDEDRLISRWEKPPEFRTGWRHAACVVIAMSNLGAGYAEKKPRKGTIGWFSPVPAAHTIRFDVMIGAPGNVGFGLPLYFVVGGIRFPSGWQVWVVATVTGPSDEYEKKMADMRLAVTQDHDWGPGARTWVWGDAGDDLGPLIFDLSSLSPEKPTRTLDVSFEDRLGIRTLMIPST